LEYYQDQKHGISEVFVCLRIPMKHYETAIEESFNMYLKAKMTAVDNKIPLAPTENK